MKNFFNFNFFGSSDNNNNNNDNNNNNNGNNSTTTNNIYIDPYGWNGCGNTQQPVDQNTEGCYGYGYSQQTFDQNMGRHSSYEGGYGYSQLQYDQTMPFNNARHSSYDGTSGYSCNSQQPFVSTFDIHEPQYGSFVGYMQQTINAEPSSDGGAQQNESDQNEKVVLGFPSLHTHPTIPGEAEPILSKDFTPYFVTNKVWETREEAMAWARGVAEPHNFMLKISRVQKTTFLKLGRTWLSCTRERVDPPTEASQASSTTKKCDCPFMLHLKEGPRDEWRMTVLHGLHNHGLPQNLKGEAFSGRPSKDEEDKIREMLSVVQEFFYRCKEQQYFVEHRLNEETNELQDVFFAHPDSIKLLGAFPYVMVLDATYSTIKSNNPYMEVIGVVNNMKNFNVAGCFLGGETNESYFWAVSQLKKLFNIVGKEPTCLVNDKEQALLNALYNIFPSSKYILCRRHIKKNIEQHAYSASRDKTMASDFSSAYYGLFKQTSKKKYEAHLDSLVTSWKSCASAALKVYISDSKSSLATV